MIRSKINIENLCEVVMDYGNSIHNAQKFKSLDIELKNCIVARSHFYHLSGEKL